MMTGLLLAAAIVLQGVTGTDLRARAFFDANNVKVGDPMVLTIDFLGNADFKALHPPALARVVGKKDWKLDDASAKTDTFREARRLTYRVRPMREGVLWFPSLEFEYAGPDGQPQTVRANEIPVHAKGGTQVVVEEMGEDATAMPQPPELVMSLQSQLGDVVGEGDEDLIFAWEKAHAKPTADGFAQFDFPAAKMNEATCAIREGNWARAMKIYQKLEWITGQTPEMEQGIVAALALRYDNPAVELPVWRQVLRPLLVFGWQGRIGIVVGGFAALALLFWLIGRGIKAVACVAVAVGCVGGVCAQGIFQQMEEEMERMHQRMQQQMQNAFGGGGFGFGFGGHEQPRKPIRITASLATSKKELRVGENFEFLVSIESPKSASLGQIRLTPSESFGLTFTGDAQNLPDGKCANTNNVVKRLSVPARYDVPYQGPLVFTIEGMVNNREMRNGGRVQYTVATNFRCDTDPLALRVKPLPSANQPEDFAGIISEGLRIHETCDILQVETNDVVTLTYRLFPKGFVPAGFLPKDAAIEWVRREGYTPEIEYRRYFVADGAARTPEVVVPYYDPRSQSYKTAKTGGTPLKYVAPKD